MNTQQILIDSRLTHMRELKRENAELRKQNAMLRDELQALRTHIDFALLAIEELRAGGKLQIWDGWNLILGAKKEAKDRDDLVAKAQKTGERVWIVFDGPREDSSLIGKIRVSYTGGIGEHRADRFICDFIRMAKYMNLSQGISVRTNDKAFQKTVNRLLATP